MRTVISQPKLNYCQQILFCIIVEMGNRKLEHDMRDERLQKQESMHDSSTTSRIYSYNCLLSYVQKELNR